MCQLFIRPKGPVHPIIGHFQSLAGRHVMKGHVHQADQDHSGLRKNGLDLSDFLQRATELEAERKCCPLT